MNSKTKQILRIISLHVAMAVGVGLVVLGTFLQFGGKTGLIAIGASVALYAYLLGAE
jgi:hypothetical protein